MGRMLVSSLAAPLLLGLLAVGCAPAPPPALDAEAEAAIREELLATTAAYNAAWEALDFERIAAFHAADFTYYRRGLVDSRSNEDFARSYRENVATQITGYWASMSDTWVKVLGPNAGIVAFVFHGGVETPDGARHPYDGALTYVLERTDGPWRITHIHESPTLPEQPD